MSNVDDAIKRFEARNADAVEEEHEGERQSKIVAFNMQELLFRTMSVAAYNACNRLGLDPRDAHGSMEPNHEKKRFEVKLVISGVALARAGVDDAKIQEVMAEEFKKASATLDDAKNAARKAGNLFGQGAIMDEDLAVAVIRGWAGK